MPEEKKNLTAVTAVLLVVLAFSLLSMVIRINVRIKKVKRPVTGSAQPLDFRNIASEAELENYFSKTAITRNPFILGGSSKEKSPGGENKAGFELTAIIWDQTRPMAIVNNKVVGINSEVNGAKIISIEKNKVRIGSANETIELELYLKGGKKYGQ